DRLADERQWRALLERLAHGPLPGALLTRSVQDVIQNRLAALVYVAEDVSSDLDEVAVELTAVPLIEHVAHLRIAHLQHVLHHTVGFADELHVAVLDAVVHHLHEVAGAAGPHPLGAWLA